MTQKTVLPIHGDDHCPGGPDPIRCLGGDFFRAYFMRYVGSPRTTAYPTGVGTTNKNLEFDWWETSDSEIFEPRAAPTYANPPVMSTDMIDKVRLKGVGHYTITMAALYNDSFLEHKLEWNDSDTPFGFSDGVYGGGDRNGAQVYNLTGFSVSTITRIYPLPDYVGDPPNAYWPSTLGSGGSVTGYVTVGSINNSGLNDNEINYAYLEILFTPFAIPPVA